MTIERRLHFETLRQLGVAMQLFAIETVDDEAAVAHDLSLIDRLTWERLFSPGTSIDDHLDAVYSTNGLNHDLYRARQVAAHLGPLWFPHRRGPYADIANVRLPGFGVDWDSPYFHGQL